MLTEFEKGVKSTILGEVYGKGRRFNKFWDNWRFFVDQLINDYQLSWEFHSIYQLLLFINSF